ncbi:MAG: HlyD family efflux transporter periplasmic adaptor subunit [Pseudomonadota bacterium]
MSAVPIKFGDEEPTLVPPLRDDLEIVDGPSGMDGSRCWLIIDPVRHAFFRVGRDVFEILGQWSRQSADQISQAASEKLHRPVDSQEVMKVAKFVVDNELTTDSKSANWRALGAKAEKINKKSLKSVVQSYIFMRIPLLRPQIFLDWTWPMIAPLFTTTFAAALAVFGALGLWMVSRQWDVFFATLVSFLSFDALIAYGAALVFVKIIHEFGHAFMAVKYRVQVPTIGVALIVLMPILFTDTSGGWRRGRRQRLMIDAAGIFAELALAVIATLFWVFLPDGSARSAAFVVATTSWVISLFVNLNPFMRFDGYYILSDLLSFENMQARGFALGRWRLREALFGFDEHPPEELPRRFRRLVILHAWGTWIYRFFLFLGIAVLVYHFFIKAAGIALFVIEIIWFIGLPIFKELIEWWERRQAMRFNRQTVRTLLVTGGVLIFFLMPYRWPSHLPAVMSAGEFSAIHPATAGQVSQIHVAHGAQVFRGDPVLTYAAPELIDERQRAELELNVIRARLARSTADIEDRSQRAVLLEQGRSIQARAISIDERLARQTVRAPADGIFYAAQQHLEPGRWISPRDTIGYVQDTNSLSVTAFVEADRAFRIGSEASGRFVPDELEHEPVKVSVSDIVPDATRSPALSKVLDINGGPIASISDNSKGGDTVPAKPHYQLQLTADVDAEIIALNAERRGTVVISGEAESLAGRVFRRVVGVLIRESGF